MMKRVCLFALSVLSLAIFSATTASAAPLRATALKSGEKVVLDGDLHDAIWQRATPYDEFIEYIPKNGDAPKYKTAYQIGYDQHAIYVAIRAYDPNPEQIRAPLARHDTITPEQDFVTVAIDAIGNKKVAQFFRANPAGATTDGIFVNDDSMDLSPDFEFSAASKQVADGYQVEMRIPFSSLRYAANVNNTWRIMLVRNIPRAERWVVLNTALPLSAASFIENMPEVLDIKLPENSHFLQVRPSLTLRQTRESVGEASNSTRNIGLGVDLKYRPTADIVLDATVHPDFSQVDVDEPRLTRNTRFAFSNPEKRAFFMEGADILQSPTNSIYTRAITAPQWGVRATMRDEGLIATAFSVRDKGQGNVLIPHAFAADSAQQPASTANVARIIRNFTDFDISAFASQRRYVDAGDNAVLGTGVTWRMNAEQRLRLQWSYATTSALPDANNVLRKQNQVGGQEWFADFFSRGDTHESSISLTRVSPNFRNDNGFVNQNDVLGLSASHSKIWRNLGDLNEFEVYADVNAKKTLSSNELIEKNVAIGMYGNAAHGLEAKLEWHGLSSARVASGANLLRPHYWHAELNYSVAAWLPKIALSTDLGHMIDFGGDRLLRGNSSQIEATLLLFNRLELVPRLQRLSLKDQGEKAITETTWHMLGVYHLSQRDSLRFILQSHSLNLRMPSSFATLDERDNSSSLTYAHRGSDGTVFYMGLTRVRDVDNTKSVEGFAKLQMNF